MRIDNEFTVGVPIERAWQVLTDLSTVAPCMPGAQLTGVEGDVYSGRMKIKVGPVISDYAGTAQFREKDDDAHHAVIDTRGRDSRGAGNASAAIHARLESRGESTLVVVGTDLMITGKIAQFGSGMIKEVSGRLLKQFVDNLEARLADSSDSSDSSDTSDTAAVAEVPSRALPPGGLHPIAQGPEPEPLDVMSIAGASIYKRLIPPLVGLAAVGVVVYLLRRP